MRKPKQVAGHCGDEYDCPKVFVDGKEAIVQGTQVTDQALLATAHPGAGETVVSIPIRMLFTAAARAAFHLATAAITRPLPARARLAR
jgi:hypothetical protein